VADEAEGGETVAGGGVGRAGGQAKLVEAGGEAAAEEGVLPDFPPVGFAEDLVGEVFGAGPLDGPGGGDELAIEFGVDLMLLRASCLFQLKYWRRRAVMASTWPASPSRVSLVGCGFI